MSNFENNSSRGTMHIYYKTYDNRFIIICTIFLLQKGGKQLNHIANKNLTLLTFECTYNHEVFNSLNLKNSQTKISLNIFPKTKTKITKRGEMFF